MDNLSERMKQAISTYDTCKENMKNSCIECEKLFEEYVELIHGVKLGRSQKLKVADLIQKFGLELVIDSFEIASDQYENEEYCYDIVLSKLGGICYNRAIPTYLNLKT